jgi:hypothetical protein
LALILEELRELEQAAVTYEKALKLRREIGQEAAAIDDLGGLARVALQQNQLQLATVYMEEAWQWIQERGVQGILSPLQVYLTIVDVMAANGRHAEAQSTTETAYQLLLQQANRFTDQATRQAFLEKVPLHQRVINRIRS